MSAKEDLDKDILATLTEEELAALEESAEEEQQAGGQADTDDDDDIDTDTDADADVEGAGAQPVEGAEAAAPAGVSQPAKVPATADSDADVGFEPAKPRTATTYRASLPADHADQVAALSTEESALADQFKAGDIDFDEFRAKTAELNQRRLELSHAEVKAEISQEMNAQTAEQVWHDTIAGFMAKVATSEGGIDYAKDAAKQRDLDTFVKVLASDDANEDKSMEWFLAEAHKRVQALHGIGGKMPDPTPGGGKPEPRRADLSALPATLAQVPGADGPGDIGDEFADIDRLDGMELEDAIAKMSPAQREKYLAAA